MAINESDAFQVFNALQAGQVPDAMKPRALSMLSAYRSESVKKMQDVFGNIQMLDAEDGSFITADRFSPGSGDKLRKKEANVLWLASRYNLPTSAIRGKYDLYKADASSMWGDAMLDDETFFSKAGAEVAKQKKKAEMIQSAQEAAFRSAVTLGDDVSDFGAWQFANPDPAAFDDEIQNAWDEEKKRTLERLGPDGLGLADRVVRTLRHEQGVATEPDAWLNQTVEMLTQLKATDPEKYDLVMAVAKAKGEKSEKANKDLAAGAAEQFARTSADIISGVPRFLVQASAEGSAQLAEAGLTTAENPELLAKRLRGKQEVLGDLKDLAEGVIDPIESKRKGWAKHAENAVYGLSGSIPTMAAAILPGGQAALTGMFANESYEDFRRAGWTGEDALAASVGAGRIQTAIERISEVAAAIPGLSGWLAKYGAKPGMSFVKTWLARTVTRNLTEGVEEALQQATAPAAQELGSAIFSSIPDRPEGQKLKDVMAEFMKLDNSIPLMLSVLPLGALGASMTTANDMALVATVTRDPRLLRAVMSEAEARKIEQEADQAVRAEMIKKAWQAAPTETIISRIKDIVKQDKKTVEESKSVLAEAEKALMIPKIRRDDQGWKVEKNGQMVRVASREAAVKIAYSSLDDYERTMYESMATIADDMLGKKEAMEISARTQTLEDEVREGRLSPIAAAKRAELSAQMSGMTPEQAQKARWVVLGKNNIEIINNVRTAVSRVFGGGNVITAMHEHAHGRWTTALRDGYVSHDEGLSWVRTAENATGLEFLPTKDDAQVTPQMLEEAIVEVISADNIGRRKEDTRFTPGAISRGIAAALLMRKRQRFGERQKGKMTEERLKDFKAFMSSYREFWGVVLRNARALMKARKEGKLGQDYQAMLDKLMNIDEAAQQETQAAQEAVDIVDGKPVFSLADSRAIPTTQAQVVEMPDGAQLLGPATFSIRAYHGTPHKVDEFTTSKIGTGEGAQAYGWGLYFAENKEVAEGYAQTVRQSIDSPERLAGQALFQDRGNRVAAIESLRAADVVGFRKEWLDAAVAAIEQNNEDSGGNLYTVELLPDSDEFLDWDKPLSDQPQAVQKFAAKHGIPADYQGNIYRALHESFIKSGNPEPAAIKEQKLTKEMAKAGIPGIKYLDAGSRGAGDGTRNYVIFDEKLVKILEENGKPIEGAAFSLAPRSLVSVADDIIAAKMAKPEYKERFYTEARERLAKIRAKQGDMIPNEASKRDRQMAALRTLDAILAAFPPEIRGKVGGFVRMADMKTDKAREKELNHRLDILEKYVERDAKKYYGEKLDKLLDRARPKREAGKKAKGKLGADVHDLFDMVEQAMDWTPEKAEAHAAGLESLIDGGTLSPEQEAHDQIEAQAVRLVAGWKDASAAQRESAVQTLTTVYETAYIEAKKRIIAQREKREADRKTLIKSTGKTGKAPERDEQMIKDLGTGTLFKSRSGFMSFAQVLRVVFGDTDVAQNIANRERAASNQLEDSVQAKMDDVDALFKRMAGGSSFDGEKLRWNMAQKTLKVQGRTLSEMDGIAATMMWMQEDGRRHMIGNLDENGKPAGGWHYNQAFVDEIESKLSPQAKQLRSFLLDAYAQEWSSLNAVYAKLNGINLPNIPLYSPITVTPMQAKKGEMVDPVTGSVMTAGSSTPSALKNRSGKIAEPDFRDALKTYIAHTKQIEHWKAYAELVADTRAILANRDVLNSVEAAAGKATRDVLLGWVDFFTEGGTREASAFLEFSRGVDAAVSRGATIALVGRLGTIFVQSTQLAAAAAKMPLGSYVVRLGKLLSGNLDYSAAFNSEFIQRRIKQQPPLVQEAMQGLLAKKPTRVKQAQRELGKLISGADGLFTAGTFAIVYDYQLKQARGIFQNEQEAAAYAMQTTESIVDEIAQPTRAGAKSLLENRLRGWGARLVWAMVSENRKNLGLMLVESMNGMTNKRFARAAFYVIALNSGLSWIVRAAWNDAKDSEDDELFDEKNWNLARLGITAATDWTKGVPILGDAIQSAAFKAAGEYQPEGNLLSGAGRGVQAGLKLAQRLDEEGVADGLLSQETINDADLILSAAGLTNDNIAAAASVAHLIKDLSKLIGNE